MTGRVPVVCNHNKLSLIAKTIQYNNSIISYAKTSIHNFAKSRTQKFKMGGCQRRKLGIT
jgi:hypothetical protein